MRESPGSAGPAGQDRDKAGSKLELSTGREAPGSVSSAGHSPQLELANEDATDPPGCAGTPGTESADSGRSCGGELQLCQPSQRDTQAKTKPVGRGVRKAKRNEIGKAPEESGDREGRGEREESWKLAATIFC